MLLWVVTGVVIMSDNGGLWSFNIIEILFFISAIAVTLSKVLGFVCKKIGQVHAFGLWYPVTFPPIPDNVRPRYKGVTVGKGEQFKIVVGIELNRRLDIRRWDIRLVQSKQGGNLFEPLPVHLLDMAVPMTATSEDTIRHFENTGFGYTVEYDFPRSRRKGESLYLNLYMKACSQWQGYLSFRGYDEDGNEHFAREQFQVFLKDGNGHSLRQPVPYTPSSRR
ncbi:MAG: hypothetical protein HYU30_09040 [Chloroflexi bacterium]|nr:hypothetical protein [Chloroflexota bacterium]